MLTMAKWMQIPIFVPLLPMYSLSPFFQFLHDLELPSLEDTRLSSEALSSSPVPQ